MCGIVVLINNQGLEVDINSLLDTIQQRGPDDRGWVTWQGIESQYGKSHQLHSDEIILGHVRLSIIDLSAGGWQPMKSSCGRYSLVYNGEIYNYRELRSELMEKSYDFSSQSDSEVLLNAIIEWREEALTKLRGMFAFAFYDSETRELFAARDFFGIKPLFWCNWEGGLAMASEASVLLDLPGVSAVSDPQATYDYLVYGASDHGTQSIYRDLRYLPAAHYAQISLNNPGNPRFQKYWEIDLNQRIYPSFEEATEQVRRLFLDSIKLHLRSDVPIGTALSGGIDSSAIVCAIRHLNPEQEIHTISYVADDVALSEEKWIDIVNQYANCIPHKVYANDEALASDMDDLIKTQGEPFGSTSIYAQYRIFEEAQKQGLKVMLDGQGADEILAGYISYKGSRLASLLVQGKLLQAFEFLKSANDPSNHSMKNILLFAANELLPDWLRWPLRRLLSKEVPPKWISRSWRISEAIDPRSNLARGVTGKEKLKKRLLETLSLSSVPHLLRYEDRNSMRFSIESRVPFLHVDLVEYLFSLPEEYLLSSNGVSKHVFREAMRGIVPDAILDRKDKVGFATPGKKWLVNMEPWIRGLFEGQDNLHCLDMKEVSREWEAVKAGKKEFGFKYWRWLNLIAWKKSR